MQIAALDVPEISDEAFVHHCYVSAFHRPCHMQEAMRALSLLASGRTRESLWREIAASRTQWTSDRTTALQSRIAMLLRRDGRDFVRGAYRMALQREADPEGMRTYLALLDSGRSRQNLLKDILDSNEARTLPSAHALREAFTALCAPDAARPRPRPRPLAVAELRALTKVERHSFIEQAYHVLLGRKPDPDGCDHYESLLARGRTKGHVIAEISRSREARQRPRSIAAAILLRLLAHL